MVVGRSTSKLTHKIVGSIQFLTALSDYVLLGCWLPQFLAIGQLTTWHLDSLRGSEQESTREYSRQKSQSLCNLISKVIFHYFKHILFLRSKSLGQAYTEYIRGVYKGMNTMRQGSLRAILETAYHNLYKEI